MTALDGYGDFDTKRLSSKPVNTILDKTEVFYMFAFRGKLAPNLVLVPLNSVPGLGRATTRKWAIWRVVIPGLLLDCCFREGVLVLLKEIIRSSEEL